MKSALLFASIVLAQPTFAANTVTCAPVESPETNVTLTIESGKVTEFATTLGERGKNPEPDFGGTRNITKYSFLVDDFYDTLYWIVVEVARDNSIVSAFEMVSGNDSDNYIGKPTQTKIECK